MTLESTIAENIYIGNGVQTVFTFTFPVWLTSEVIVKMDDVLQVHGGTVDVVITNADAGTGTVTFTVAPADSKEVILKRAVAQKQESEFPLRAKLNSEELEKQLDRTVAMIQDNTRDLQNNTFNWRGTWSALKNYSIGDAVFWSGTAYRANAAHINHEPPNTSYWDTVAIKGDSGGLVWRGTWNSLTSYAVGDGVTYNGTSYICVATSTNNAPPNVTYWNVLAEAGSDGEVSGPAITTRYGLATWGDTAGILLDDNGLGTAGQVWTSNGPGTPGSFKTISSDSLFRARLTLESGVLFSTADQTAKTTLYVKGTKIPILSGGTTSFLNITAGEISKSLTGLSNTVPTDVFVRSNGGTEADTIELVAWTSTTARSVALTYQALADYYVHSTNTNWTYVGTIMGSASGQCEYGTSFCGLWTFARTLRTDKFLVCSQGNDTWTYASATIREARNQSTLGSSRVGVVVGLAEDLAMFEARHMAITSTASAEAGTWIGINSTNTNSAQIRTPSHFSYSGNIATAIYQGYLPIGYNIISWLENSIGASSLTFIGDNGSSYQSGMFGRVRC